MSAPSVLLCQAWVALGPLLAAAASTCISSRDEEQASDGMSTLQLKTHGMNTLQPKTFGMSTLQVQTRFISTLQDHHADLGEATACGQRVFVTSSSNVSAACPRECRFYVEDNPERLHCAFQCVPGPRCAEVNPATPIADEAVNVCTGCSVIGCARCAVGSANVCVQCKNGNRLRVDGQCTSAYAVVWTVVFSVLGLLLGALLVWYLDLLCRTPTNESNLLSALKFRERSKLGQVSGNLTAYVGAEAGSPGKRVCKPWPLTTNLLRENVGGSGLIMFFNFQAAVMIWAVVIGLAWVTLGLSVNKNLLTLGMASVDTPREYCIMVQWGWEEQQHMLGVKECFVFGVYLFSFSGALLYGVLQRRHFADKDNKETTFKDFAALCTGLPPLPGSERWEERLKESIEKATAQSVVGVSVCWDFRAEEERLAFALRSEVAVLEGAPRLPKEPAAETKRGSSLSSLLTRRLQKLEAWLLLGCKEEPQAAPEDPHELLRKLRSTQSAFVVFASERARDAALEAMARPRGLRFEEATVHLETVSFEPGSVFFRNFAVSARDKIWRFSVGVCVVGFAQTLWTAAFYLPYAYWNLKYADSGMEPGNLSSFSFGLVVVIGNQIMYYVCREVASRVGFARASSLEACYLVLYSGAVLFNVLVDMVMTYATTYYTMTALGIKTHDGTPLAELRTVEEVFRTFIMQKTLGWQLFLYCFPATFLVPFLVEPIFAVFIPLRIMARVVKTHPEVGRHQAEDCIAALPMDLGRYGDLTVNVILAVLSFFFSSGYVLPIFGTLVVSHLYIYGYDHWRVLRVVPAFCLSNTYADECAQAMLAVPCGLLLSYLTLKMNCTRGFPCLHGYALVVCCFGTFMLHVFVHLLLLATLVPLLSRTRHVPSEGNYNDCAQNIACSWFTANPVHCLRSKYIYQHDPPCGPHIVGKEHLLRYNEAAGQFFELDRVRSGANFCDDL